VKERTKRGGKKTSGLKEKSRGGERRGERGGGGERNDAVRAVRAYSLCYKLLLSYFIGRIRFIETLEITARAGRYITHSHAHTRARLGLSPSTFPTRLTIIFFTPMLHEIGWNHHTL